MALGLPERGGEDRTPIVKYDARAGRLFRVDRTQADGSWESNTVEITPVFQAIFDMERIEVGHLYFPTNGAPDIIVVPYGQEIPPKPAGGNHKPGFRVYMLLGKQAGGDLREMASNAQSSIKGMNALHDEYLKGVKDHPGMLPVVRLEKTIAVSSSGKDASGKQVSSTNYQPCWTISKWTARPPELSGQHASGAHAETPHEPPHAEQQRLPDPEPMQMASVEDDF
jgi:hypothetical protein